MARILVVVSAATKLQLKDGSEHATGHFLGELAHPVQALLDHGYELTFASPNGAAPAIDQDSLRDLYWLGDAEGRQAALALVASLPGWTRPEVLEHLTAADLEAFSGVFVPGGHAPMVDLARLPSMAKVLLHFHERQLPIGLICHAPAVLLSTGVIEPWPFAGYRLTVFGHLEEKIAETLFLHGDVPFYPDHALRALGATVDNALLPSMPHVVTDRHLITGQNPYSAKRFAEAFSEALLSASGAGLHQAKTDAPHLTAP